MDFIVEKEGEIIPIEVKINASEKIEKSLHSFVESYTPKKAFIVSYKGKEKTVRDNGCSIVFTNVFNLVKQLQSAS